MEHLYDIADYLHIPLLALTGAGVGAKSDLSDYPYLSRISITHTMTSKVILKFLRQYGYTNVVFLTDLAVSFNSDMHQVFLKTLRMQVSSLLTYKFPTFCSTPGILEDYTKQLIFRLLRDCALNARGKKYFVCSAQDGGGGDWTVSQFYDSLCILSKRNNFFPIFLTVIFLFMTGPIVRDFLVSFMRKQ